MNIKKIGWKEMLLIAVICIGIFLRFYQISNIPAGLTNDEADIGYDAYSLLKTGKDQWNQSFPVSGFIGFGDYRPALYTYLVVPFVALLDLQALAVRFPSALFGVLSIIAVYFLGLQLFGKGIGVASAFIFAVTPWSIALSRVGIESNVAIFFMVLGIYLFTKIGRDKKYLYGSIFLFILTIYTYTAYTLFVPILLFILSITYKNELLRIKKDLFIVLILSVVLLVPIISRNTAAGVRFSQVGVLNNINSIGLINDLNDHIGSCSKTYPLLVCKLVNNKISLFVSTTFKNYISHYSFSLLYFNGTTTQYGILPPGGLHYVFEMFFFLIGIGLLLISKKKEGYLLIALLLISSIPDSLTSDGHYSRASLMLPFLVLVEGFGLYNLIQFIRKRNMSIQYAFTLLFIPFIIFSVVSFFVTYTTYFKDHHSIYSHYGYEELISQINNRKNSYDQIYISRKMNDTKQYIYYLFYNKYDPVSFQNKKDIVVTENSDGWISVDRINSVYFVDSIPSFHSNLENNPKKVLFVSHPSDFSNKLIPQFEVKDRLGNTLFKAIEFEKISSKLTGLQ